MQTQQWHCLNQEFPYLGDEEERELKKIHLPSNWIKQNPVDPGVCLAPLHLLKVKSQPEVQLSVHMQGQVKTLNKIYICSK